MPNQADASIVCAHHVHISFEESSNCKSYSIKSKLPETMLTVMRLILHIKRVSFEKRVIVVNRFEYVITARLLYPRGRIIFFKHTIGRFNESKYSDSIWRKMPRVYRTLEDIAFRLAFRVWTFDESDLTERNQRFWSLLKPSADLSLFQDQSQKNNHVAWIGRLEAPKNPELGARILTELTDFGYKTVLVGSGSLHHVVKPYVTAGGVLRANLDKKEVAMLLGETKVLLMTSDFEAAPRVMIEALSSGCFIVCTPMSDPNKLILEFPSRIFHFDTFAQALGLIEILVTKQNECIDLREYENEVVFRNVWNDIVSEASLP
jgi:glycosyltransferase involved in cell wall biosynthesis